MSAQDKLGVGLLIFLAMFVVAFLLVPREVYQAYFANLKNRSHGRIINALGLLVFALSLPYFYDVLVGFDNPATGRRLEVLIGGAAYWVLIDAAYFAYKHYCIPAFTKRRGK